MICASHPVAPYRHWRGHISQGGTLPASRNDNETGEWRCPTPAELQALPASAHLLGSPGTGARTYVLFCDRRCAPHPATSGYLGRRGPRRDTLRRS